MVSFHEQATTPACRRGLAHLRDQAFISDFYLAGGTALALQIGHRISTDLDWFSVTCHLNASDRDEIHQALSGSKQFQAVSEQDGMLYGRLFGADTSFIYQHHPLLEPTVEYQGVRLASPTDLGLPSQFPGDRRARTGLL